MNRMYELVPIAKLKSELFRKDIANPVEQTSMASVRKSPNGQLFVVAYDSTKRPEEMKGAMLTALACRTITDTWDTVDL